MKGYLVEFNGIHNDTAFCDTLNEATAIRNMVAGGGIIYAAHTEKKGYNSHVIVDYMMRKRDGTPL